MDDKAALLAATKTVLQKNHRGNFTIPARGLYPHQWLWDSCFIAIGLANYDMERAKLEILSLLRGQWKNGMLPHIIFTPGKPQAMHHGIWQSWVSPFSPDGVSTSGITQPPVVAEAVVRIGEKLPALQRRNWYRQVWPSLIAYHQWIYRERDPRGAGLALLIHPWETGMDNTPSWMNELRRHLLPRWIRAMQKTHLDGIISWFRTDTRYVPAAQRMSNIEVLALFDAQLRLRRKAYDITRVLADPLFAIEDLAFNCMLIRANTLLREIARSLREDIPEELDTRMTLTEKALEQLWDPYAGQYYSRDFITHRLLPETSVAALLPLYAGSITAERARLLVGMLENAHLFGTAYPAPSTAANSPAFKPVCYWQGPAWVNMNWLIIDGLTRYGFHQHAAALRESTLEMVAKSGCHEYFNALTGEGLGIDNFSWTAALILDLLHR